LVWHQVDEAEFPPLAVTLFNVHQISTTLVCLQKHPRGILVENGKGIWWGADEGHETQEDQPSRL
jgi:hypothetical protein